MHNFQAVLRITHLLWIQDFNDLCNGPRVKCRDDTAARRQKLQLECLKNKTKASWCLIKYKYKLIDLFALKKKLSPATTQTQGSNQFFNSWSAKNKIFAGPPSFHTEIQKAQVWEMRAYCGLSKLAVMHCFNFDSQVEQPTLLSTSLTSGGPFSASFLPVVGRKIPN